MKRVFVVSILVLAFVSCARSTDEAAARIVSYQPLSSTACPMTDKEPSAHLIRDQATYQQLIPSARTMGSAPSPAVDFSRHDILLFSMGEKPTAGYRLKTDGLSQKGARLFLTVNWQTPQGIAAQVMTYPCLQLLMEKSQARFLIVRDQHARVLLDTELQ